MGLQRPGIEGQAPTCSAYRIRLTWVHQSCSSVADLLLHVSLVNMSLHRDPMQRLRADSICLPQQANATKMQKRMRNKPRSGAQLAADVVERAIATGGEPYLEVRAKDMQWWQLSLLDVKLFLTGVALALLAIVAALLYGLFLGLGAGSSLGYSYVMHGKEKAS